MVISYLCKLYIVSLVVQSYLSKLCCGCCNVLCMFYWSVTCLCPLGVVMFSVCSTDQSLVFVLWVLQCSLYVLLISLPVFVLQLVHMQIGCPPTRHIRIRTCNNTTAQNKVSRIFQRISRAFETPPVFSIFYTCTHTKRSFSNLQSQPFQLVPWVISEQFVLILKVASANTEPCRLLAQVDGKVQLVLDMWVLI